MHVLERSTRLLFLRERELDRERGRSEGLLRNILPEAIADRLKQRDPATEHGAIAQAYGEVTVVFADLGEFTKQSGTTDPPEIVAVLDDVFTRFDAIAERCGLEKIKTIGDAYMAVAGVPSHARTTSRSPRRWRSRCGTRSPRCDGPAGTRCASGSGWPQGPPSPA